MKLAKKKVTQSPVVHGTDCSDFFPEFCQSQEISRTKRVKLHFHLYEHGSEHDTNLYPDYGHVSFVSIFAVSIVIFPSFKDNLYAAACESVYGNGRIAK